MASNADPVPLRAGRVRRELVTAVRYGVVGLTNTALYLALSGGMLAIDVTPAFASAAAWGLAAMFSFVANQGWTFDMHSSRPHAFARFAVVQLASAGAVTGGALLVADLAGTGPFLAEICVLPLVVASAYVINRTWVFAGG
jgi:putative flippase GtrA